jgi:hypothetical protein
VIELGRSCSRHRAALVDFVDRGEIRPETAPALAHLDRCDRCTEAIESTVLTITALRRYGEMLDEAAPSADAWPRLAARITSWRRRPVAMSPIAGLAMSLAMVVAVVLPGRLNPGELAAVGHSAAPAAPFGESTSSTSDDIRAADRAAGAYARSNSIVVENATKTIATAQVVRDDVRITVKEVSESGPASRLARAI